MSKEKYKARLQRMLKREEDYLLFLKQYKAAFSLIRESEGRIGYLKKQLEE